MQREDPKNTWDQVLKRIQSKVSSHSFSTWFKPTRYISEDEANVKVGVPNNWFAEWLRTNYSHLIQDSLRELQRPGLGVDFRPETLEIPAPEMGESQFIELLSRHDGDMIDEDLLRQDIINELAVSSFAQSLFTRVSCFSTASLVGSIRPSL